MRRDSSGTTSTRRPFSAAVYGGASVATVAHLATMAPAFEPWNEIITLVFNAAFTVMIGHILLPLFPPTGRTVGAVVARIGRALAAPLRRVTVRGSATVHIHIGKLKNDQTPDDDNGRTSTGFKGRR
jgi:hypothetical protein